ncbi:MAG: YihY/virulence factor BrkB family protein [Coraliomargarita sp.]
MSNDRDHTSAKTAAPLMDRLREPIDHAQELLGKDIWELEHLGRRTVKARTYLLLRVLTLTWQGLRRNKIPVQAAALTFYSLIGIGPLIALAIMLSGFAIEKGSEEKVIQGITKVIAFAAPQVALDVDGPENGAAELNPQIYEMIQGFSQSAQSGVGFVGLAMLFFIGIQVLSSIEGSFNTLWGVDLGRKWSERIVVYWTFISMGAVLGVASATLTVVSFVEELPFGGLLSSLIQFTSPILVFSMVVVLLAVFFRFIPNIQVKWKPAFIGSFVVVFMLHVYNWLSFLYVQRVVDTNSLYGSVGIIIILMLGLYIFWLLILLGGQITYAVQNADYLTNENAWQKTSQRSREVVSLGVMLLVAQRFQNCIEPIRASELHQALRVPSHILNVSLNRLCDLGYLYPVGGNSTEDLRDRAYQPGRPMDSLTLKTFKQDFECYGNNEGAELLAKAHPGISSYLNEILSLEDNSAADQKISDLILRG